MSRTKSEVALETKPTIESLKEELRWAEDLWVAANREARQSRERANSAFQKFQMAQLSLNTALECMLALAKSEGQV